MSNITMILYNSKLEVRSLDFYIRGIEKCFFHTHLDLCVSYLNLRFFLSFVPDFLPQLHLLQPVL